MRLRSIDTLWRLAIAFLPIFMADYNTRFAKGAVRRAGTCIVPSSAMTTSMDAFAWKEDRTVSKKSDAAIRQGAVHPGAE